MISHTGYRRDSIHKDRPMNMILSRMISMKGVDHPVIGSDGITTRMMMPGEEHEFANPLVTEIPVKGLFALMARDMMANGSLPGGGKPKALLDDGTAVKQQRPATAQEKFDSFMQAHPEARGTKWEQEGRRLVKESESKGRSLPVKSTPVLFNHGGEMNKNEFLTTIARIAAKKAKIPMNAFPPAPEDEGEDVLEYLQRGGEGAMEYPSITNADVLHIASTLTLPESMSKFNSLNSTDRNRVQKAYERATGYSFRDIGFDHSGSTQTAADSAAYLSAYNTGISEQKRRPEGRKAIFENALRSPRDPYAQGRSKGYFAKYQTGGQVPQEIIDMYLDQQGRDHLGTAASGFTNTLDDLFGSAYQTQRDRINIEDFNPEVQTAQDGAEVPAYIKRNRYRGYVPNYQNAVQLNYQGADAGLTHPGVIAPVNWGQSTLGSYDVKYRNPIWGKNVKRREHYEFYTPYGAGTKSGPVSPYQSSPAVPARTPRPVPPMSTGYEQSPYKAQSHVDVPYMDAGMLDGSSMWQDPNGVSNFDPATGRIIQPSQSPAEKMKMGKLLLKKGYLTPGLQKSLRDADVAKSKETVKKYDYLLHPEQQRTRVDEELLQKQRENEYRMLKSQFRKGGSIEDRLKAASEFYRKGGMKC